MIILKKYYEHKLRHYYNDNKKNITHAELQDTIYDYGKQLEKEGWIDDMMEGGFVSPNLSTIYYYSRSPYEGQLIQFRGTPQAREQFQETVKKLSKDFIQI